MEDSHTLEILKQLEQGKISIQQAQERLSGSPPVERDYMPRVEAAKAPAWIRAVWIYFMLSGLVIVGVGAWIITATINANVLWWLLGLPILLLGALVLGIGADLQMAHWVYVNIARSRRSMRPIRVAVPLPMGLVWTGLWIAKRIKPGLTITLGKAGLVNANWKEIEDFIKEMERALSKDGRMSVDVDEGDEHVQVHIV